MHHKNESNLWRAVGRGSFLCYQDCKMGATPTLPTHQGTATQYGLPQPYQASGPPQSGPPWPHLHLNAPCRHQCPGPCWSNAQDTQGTARPPRPQDRPVRCSFAGATHQNLNSGSLRMKGRNSSFCRVGKDGPSSAIGRCTVEGREAGLPKGPLLKPQMVTVGCLLPTRAHVRAAHPEARDESWRLASLVIPPQGAGPTPLPIHQGPSGTEPASKPM